MNRAIFVSLLVSAALPVVACGGGSSSSPSAPPASLDGHWISDTCESSPGANGSTSYFKRDFTIDDTTWKLVFSLFGDAACTTRIASFDIGGPYAVAGASGVVSGAREARFEFATRRATAYVQPMVDALSGAHCGTGAWKLGEAQDILDAGCPAVGAYPKQSCPADFDVVRVDGARLWFGARPADNDMCTAEKRPQALGAAAVVKQP